MILESFIAANGALLASRMVHTKVENDSEISNKILNEGIYHVTTLENANKIMESGHIRPSNNFISMGRKKCFFFAGAPDINNLSSNCASSATSYEYTAIKVNLNEEDLKKFKHRSLNDDAITYIGKCNLDKEKSKIVQMVLDLDEKGEVVSREKTEEEIEKGEYIPNDKLKEAITFGENTKVEMIKRLAVDSYLREYGVVLGKMKKLAIKAFDKITGRTDNIPLLESAKIKEENTFLAELKKQAIVDGSQFRENTNVSKEKENEELEI